MEYSTTQNTKVQFATPHPLFIALIKSEINNKFVENVIYRVSFIHSFITLFSLKICRVTVILDILRILNQITCMGNF